MEEYEIGWIIGEGSQYSMAGEKKRWIRIFRIEKSAVKRLEDNYIYIYIYVCVCVYVYVCVCVYGCVCVMNLSIYLSICPTPPPE